MAGPPTEGDLLRDYMAHTLVLWPEEERALARAVGDGRMPVELCKAIKPGDPATAGLSREELYGLSSEARARSEASVTNLQDMAVGIFTNYERLWHYAQMELSRTRKRADKRAIIEDLQKARSQTERALQGAIREAYSTQFAQGRVAGWNMRPGAEAEEKAAVRLRRDEFVFVKRFLDDIEHGRTRMPIEQRAMLYGNAAREAFWQGWLYADQSSDRYVRWVNHEAEHCPDCTYMSGAILPGVLKNLVNPNLMSPGGRWGNGVYSAQELLKLGVVPQSGTLRCTTRCRCRLERAERPEEKPSGALQARPYVSLAPKLVQKPYQDRRRRYQPRRIKRDGRVSRVPRVS
jgi:hypothetical protein